MTTQTRAGMVAGAYGSARAKAVSTRACRGGRCAGGRGRRIVRRRCPVPVAGASLRPPQLPSAPHVGDAVPARLGRELDRLVVPVRLDVDEHRGVLVVADVELALLDALIEPCASEDQPTQPMHERALGRTDELWPAVVDVLA